VVSRYLLSSFLQKGSEKLFTQKQKPDTSSRQGIHNALPTFFEYFRATPHNSACWITGQGVPIR
jgi:hypothetical protein